MKTDSTTTEESNFPQCTAGRDSINREADRCTVVQCAANT